MTGVATHRRAVSVSTLLNCGHSFSRTVEDDIIVDQVDAPDIVDDFELGQDEVVDIKDKEVNKQKLRRRTTQYKVS